MTLKDWILLLVPILSNGIIVFALQKIFEKKRLVRDNKRVYITNFKEYVEKALELHMQIAIVFGAESIDYKLVEQTMTQFIENVQKIAHFQYVNQSLLKPIEEKTQQLVDMTNNMTNYIKQNDYEKLSCVYQNIKCILDDLQHYCVNF